MTRTARFKRAEAEDKSYRINSSLYLAKKYCSASDFAANANLHFRPLRPMRLARLSYDARGARQFEINVRPSKRSNATTP
jgi:hypothetical protein